MTNPLAELVDLLLALDRRTVEVVVAARSPLLTKVFTSVTGLGSATAAAVLLGLFRRADWDEEFREAGVALLVTGAAVGLLMATVGRPFPPQPVCLTDGPAVASSFPSGHAAAATVFTLTARRSSVLPLAVVAPLALLVAVSRVYLGTHYLTDTVAGVAIGAAAVLLARSLLRRGVLDLDEV